MYNKLFTKILDSSIWLEDAHIRLVWITFLAVMDQDGTVALSGIGNVALRARVTEKEAEDAIHCLENPDHRNPDQDNGGRRIERIPGMGWFVLNAGKYRDIIKAETVRAQNRERVRRHRATGNADVMPCNEMATPSEAEAVSEAGEREPPLLEIHLGKILTGVMKDLGLKTTRGMGSRKEWIEAGTIAFENGFSSEQFIECFSLLRQQRSYTILPKYVTDNLPELAKLRKRSNAAAKLPTTEEKLADDAANRAAIRRAPQPIIQ